MAEPEHGDLTVSAWIKRFARLIPHTLMPALDLACRHDGHVRLLRAAGHRVVTLDCDETGIAARVVVDDVGRRTTHTISLDTASVEAEA